MTLSTRIKGTSAIFKLASVDYSQDCSSIVLDTTAGKTDVVTFADAAAGGAVTWQFTVKAIQATDTTALWAYLWGAAGTLNVAYSYSPQGNATGTPTKPIYTGTVNLGPKPTIGGDADTTFVFTVVLDCDQDPLKVIA